MQNAESVNVEPIPGGPTRTSGAPARRRHRWTLGLGAAAVAIAALVLGACSGTSGTTAPHSTATAASGTTVYRWGVVGNKGAISQLQLDTPTAIAGIPGRVVQIATSNSDGYARTSTGAVYGWGVNSYGELGDGQLTPYETKAFKVQFPAGVTITSLANPMPFDGALAIDSTGHAWGWGLNAADDLCLSGLVEKQPQQLPLADVTLATGARTHALVDAHGTVYSCGSGDAGELGNGSTASASTPTPVVGLPDGVKVTALTSSWEGSGALLGNGDYYNWGYNAAGQLGNGSTTNSAVPVKVALPDPVTQVFQGGSGAKNGQTIAILRNRAAWTWGNNDRGQLGIGSRTNSGVPVQVHVPKNVVFVNVSSGGYASYGIDQAGQLWAWGDNRSGQLGTGTGTELATLPVKVGIHLTQVSSTAQNVAGFGARR
jgi:alpha-tubulin suppressor-like RCC1 family protein